MVQLITHAVILGIYINLVTGLSAMYQTFQFNYF